MLLSIAGWIALGLPAAAQEAPALSVGIDGTSRAIPLATSNEWREEWSPGAIDVWIASRRQGKSWTVEYEFSARAHTPKTEKLTLQLPGGASRSIAVGVAWPAGRSLSGRLGEELPLFSDWPERKRKFGPLEIPLPAISDVAAQSAWAAEKLAGLRGAIASRSNGGFAIEDSLDGLYAAQTDSPAWIGPWGCWTMPDPGPGAPGGSGITHASGWQDNENYARLACEVEALAMGRMWCFLNADGTRYSVDQFRQPAVESPNCTSEANVKPEAFGGARDPHDPLWRPISISHYPRVLRYCQAAYEMTGSRLARRHLIQLAESARLQFSEWGHDSHGGGWIAWNLTSWEALIAQHPPHSGLVAPEFGLGWDRNHGWMLWAAAEAKKAGMPWTPGWEDWSKRMLAALTRTQMKNGLFCRAYIAAYPKVDVCGAMHEALLGMGLLALHVQAKLPIPSILPGHAEALYQQAPSGTYHGQVGPLHFLAVAPRGGEPYKKVFEGYPEPSLPGEPGDPIAAEAYLAAVYALTGDQSFFVSALKYGTPALTREQKLTAMRAPGLGALRRNGQAFLLGQMQ